MLLCREGLHVRSAVVVDRSSDEWVPLLEVHVQRSAVQRSIEDLQIRWCTTTTEEVISPSDIFSKRYVVLFSASKALNQVHAGGEAVTGYTDEDHGMSVA
jgi:hypothetical protein